MTLAKIVTSRSNVWERPPRSDIYFGRDGPVFRERLLESADSEFVPIIHLYKMSKMESGS